MDTSKFIKVELVKHDKKVKDISDLFGISRQATTARFSRNVWDVNDLEKIADMMNCNLSIEFIPRR